MTPRPRSRDKVVPISIGIPVSLMMRLDNEISYRQSRSLWVKSAIIQKLDESFDYDSIPSVQLIAMLLNREIIDYEMAMLLRTKLDKSTTP